MSSSNQATELSMDDILASIRRIIAEEPAGKGGKPGPRLGPLAEPADAHKDVSPEIAQRGARSSFNQLTQRLNEVLETQESPLERKQDQQRDSSLGLGKPEDLDQPYTTMRKPPPVPEPVNPPASEEAAPTRVVSSTTNEMLRRQVWSQTDGNINNRIGRLDPKPLTTTLARAVGSAPAVAFDAYRRKSEAEPSAPGFGSRSTPPLPAGEGKKPAAPPAPEAKAIPPLPAEAKAPPAMPVPPAVPADPVPAKADVEDVETGEVDALAGRLAASMRDLDATLGARTADKKPEEKPLAVDTSAKARSAPALPEPKPWPDSREPAKAIPPLEKAAAPEAKPEAKPAAMSDTAKFISTEKPPHSPLFPAAKDLSSAPKAKAPLPPVSAPAGEKVTAAEAAAMLVKAAAPLTPGKAAAPPPADEAAVAKAVANAVAHNEPAPKPIVAEPMAPAATPAPAASLSPAPVRTLEDTVSDLLRPVLRQWLDEHMPRIFERVLREELAGRVTPPPKP